MSAPASRAETREEGPFRVLLVCTANHCRSPLAEAMLRRRVEERGLASKVVVESAALRQVKIGCGPSRKMVEVARRRGLELTGLATWASPDRIAAADLVICMDHEQAEEIAREFAMPDEARLGRISDDGRVRLLLEFAMQCGRDEVPDPQGLDDFAHERAADLIEQGVEGLAEALADRCVRRD